MWMFGKLLATSGNINSHLFSFPLLNFTEIRDFSESWSNPKNGMVTRAIIYLATNTLPMVKIQSSFPLLPLGSYLLPFTTLNNGNFFFTTTSKNLSVLNYEVSLVTILLMNFIAIYWIHWIRWKSFRKNTIGYPVSPCLNKNYLQPTYVILKENFWKKDTKYSSK